MLHRTSSESGGGEGEERGKRSEKLDHDGERDGMGLERNGGVKKRRFEMGDRVEAAPLKSPFYTSLLEQSDGLRRGEDDPDVMNARVQVLSLPCYQSFRSNL